MATLAVVHNGSGSSRPNSSISPRRVSGVPTLVIMWAAGRNMHAWIKDIALVENLAKERGFKQLHIWGRKGFERMLKAEGFRHEFTVIGKSLDYEVN
jgi:hypothetical protein